MSEMAEMWRKVLEQITPQFEAALQEAFDRLENDTRRLLTPGEQ